MTGTGSISGRRDHPQRPTMRATVARLTPTSAAIWWQKRRCRWRRTLMRNAWAGAVARGECVGREAIARAADSGHPSHPLAHRLFRDRQCPRDLARRLSEHPHAADGVLSTSRRQPGILVDVHPGLLIGISGCLAAPDSLESVRMDNPPADNLLSLHV